MTDEVYDACPECAGDVELDDLGLYFCLDDSCGWREDVKELSFNSDNYSDLEPEASED